MSTNLKYKQVVNVSRRTWDLETYEKRAQDRANKNTNSQDGTIESKRKQLPLVAADNEEEHPKNEEEFRPAASNAIGPQSSNRAFLKARTKKISSLDAKIGSVEIINPEGMAATSRSIKTNDNATTNENAVTKMGVGWHCKVCDCYLKDSLAYLDHINGRKHQRNLGYSMRVERSTKDQVDSRLEALVKKANKKKQTAMDDLMLNEKESLNGSLNGPLNESLSESLNESFHDRVLAKDQELQEKKRLRKERKKAKKLLLKQQKTKGHSTFTAVNLNNNSDNNSNNETKQEQTESFESSKEDDGADNGLMDPDMAAIMGFAGFGGGNKNR